MTLHKFVIGQAVDFDRRFPSMSRPTGPFEVVSALPIGEDNSPTYRVKSNAEPFARVAGKPISSPSACRRANKRRRYGPIFCLNRLGRSDRAEIRRSEALA